MTFYALLIFLHVAGAVLLFVALGIEAVAVTQLREAIAVAPARSWNRVRRRWGWAGWIAIVIVLASGIWMMALRWGPRAWIITGFAGLLIIAIVGAAVAFRVRPRIQAGIGYDADSSRPTVRAAADSLLFSVRLRAAVGVAVLGLMTIRPGALASISTLAAAVLLVVVHRLAVAIRPSRIAGEHRGLMKRGVDGTRSLSASRRES